MDAGKVVGIPIIDHVVVAEHGFHSFQENGDMAE
jgi:DNA repair protein RadC